MKSNDDALMKLNEDTLSMAVYMGKETLLIFSQRLSDFCSREKTDRIKTDPPTKHSRQEPWRKGSARNVGEIAIQCQVQNPLA